MPTLLFKNNASTTLSGSINNTQTSFTVGSSSGFPTIAGSDYFYATMYEVSANVEINIEIVKVTGVSGSTWTVVRAQDGTTARSRNGVTDCFIELRWTAASGELMVQRDNNLSDLANAATARTNLGLGSIATQDASAVAITGGTISGVTLTSLDASTTIQDNADATKQFRFEASGITAGATRVLTVPDADGTIATTAAIAAGYQPLDADLTAVAGLSTTGVVARTGAGTVSTRTLTAPAAGFTITNGDGVAGNPTFVLANDLAAAEAINTTGFVRRTATDTWSASAIVDGDLPAALTGKTYNALTLTAAATGFSVAGGTTSKTLTVSNSITLAGTDGTTITLPATTGTVALNDQTFFLGTTSIAINRTSASISLTGVNIDGTAGSATNIASGVLGSVPYQSSAGATTLLAPNTTSTRNFLRMTGTGTIGAAPVWDTVTKADVGLSSVEDTALSTWAGSSNLITLGTVTNGVWNGSAIGISYGGTGATSKAAGFNALSPVTTLGDLIYGDGSNSNTRLAGNTTTSKRFLTQTGTGSASAAPGWNAIVDGDIPSALTGKTYNGLTPTANATGFSLAGGTTSKTLTVNNNLTLSGNDGATLNFGAGGSFAYTDAANNFTAGQTIQGNLTFSGTARRIIGDFSNGTLNSRTLFQSSTTNSETSVGAVPNGTSRVANSAWFNTADPTNSGYLTATISDTQAQVMTGATGTGSAVPLILGTSGTVRVSLGLNGAIDLSTGMREARIAMGANEIDVRAGNYFTKTISGATTFTVANVPSAGTTANFVLDLTNGGSATITWWSGVKWAGGTAPTLTSAGRDVLGFFTHDGGTTWTGLLLGKDVK